MKIIERTINTQTGETVDIERDETAAEKKVREAVEKQYEDRKAEADAKETARQIILNRLGISVEELKTILN